MFKKLLALFTDKAASRAPASAAAVDMQAMHSQILRQNKLKRMERNERRHAQNTTRITRRSA